MKAKFTRLSNLKRLCVKIWVPCFIKNSKPLLVRHFIDAPAFPHIFACEIVVKEAFVRVARRVDSACMRRGCIIKVCESRRAPEREILLKESSYLFSGSDNISSADDGQDLTANSHSAKLAAAETHLESIQNLLLPWEFQNPAWIMHEKCMCCSKEILSSFFPLTALFSVSSVSSWKIENRVVRNTSKLLLSAAQPRSTRARVQRFRNTKTLSALRR